MKYKLSKTYPKKRAFITGAASGLGLSLCRELAADGWTIGMADINETALQKAANEIEKRGGIPLPLQLDVADKIQFAKVKEDFINKTGGIDLLVNNAGVGDAGYVEEYSLENWEWLLGINQFGVINGCHFFLPVMKKQNSGTIINVASAAAFSTLPAMGAYNMSKAAVLSLSETLNAELAAHDVYVSVVMPTFFKTKVMQYSRGSEEHIERSRLVFGTSTLEPQTVARQVLKKADRKKFYIILPFQARFIFWLKRYFPGLALRLFKAAESKRDFFQQRLQRKFEKMERAGKLDREYMEEAFGEKADKK